MDPLFRFAQARRSQLLFFSLACSLSLAAQSVPAAPAAAAPDTQNAPAQQDSTPSPQNSPAPADQSPAQAPAAPQPENQPPAAAPPPQAPQPPVQFSRTLPARPLRYSGSLGSTYIPLDSWIYPELLRLYSLGFIDTLYLGQRPYTRTSVAHMLDASASDIYNSDSDEAKDIYSALSRELATDLEVPVDQHLGHSEIESVYTRALGITGRPLRDSWHVGQSIVNDYGRPYAEGFNNITGVSARTTIGRYSGYLRGEFQHAPQLEGYSLAVANRLRDNDPAGFDPNFTPTLPFGKTLRSVDTFRIQEAYVAVNLASHEISCGKHDDWWGPGRGGGMAYSNNAEDIYAVRINRVEPLYIPLISKVLGPVRYDFLYGSLQGHSTPRHDYTHSEGFTFKPTRDFEFGFERTIVFGGQGHEPVTWDTFLRGFFSVNDTTQQQKESRKDPGARFSSFNFSWRLPYLRDWVTLYTDSTTHDDVTPVSAPRRAGFRPGVYISHFPGAPKLALRVEGAETDPDTGRSTGGSLLYWEVIQRQAYTNKGFTFGDWIGRESKGGQAWLTYHLSGNEWVELQYRNAKAVPNFIPLGTTQNDFAVNAVKRLGKDVEVNAWVQYERWKAPFILNGDRSAQSDTSISLQLTYFPRDVHRF